MTDRLPKSNRANLTDTRNATFSQALEAGLTHYDYLDGRKTGRSGREAALVSHSVSPAKAKELKTNDTFGPLFDGLSPKNDLQQSLENRLRQAMAVNGCQEYVLTWKRWDMKSGPPICALRASGRRISGKGYSGWQSPKASDCKSPGKSSTSKWKTPDGWDTSKGDGGHGSYHKNGREKGYTGYRPKGPQKGYKRPNKEAASVGPMARGKEGFNHQFADPERVWDDGLTRNKRSVWTVSTKPFSGAHFATFPPDLILPCILAGCPEGGTVLDPFFGSGTTGIVAYQQDRKFIGIELSEKYLSEIVIPRIKKETEQLKLF
jgi:hypothetical protein